LLKAIGKTPLPNALKSHRSLPPRDVFTAIIDEFLNKSTPFLKKEKVFKKEVNIRIRCFTKIEKFYIITY
jgi:hypothetical protein